MKNRGEGGRKERKDEYDFEEKKKKEDEGWSWRIY